MEIILGTNKIIQATKWKAKTKKDFVSIFKKKGSKVSEQDIVDSLVLPYIDNTDLYLSPDEIQYILIQLRGASISDKIEFSMDCDNKSCQNNFDVVTNLGTISTYQANQYPIEVNGIIWKDLNNSKSLENAIKKFPDEMPQYIEMLLHIESFNGELISSFSQIVSLIDDLSIMEYEILEEDFKKVQSHIEIEQEVICSFCGVPKRYSFDIIPTFFDPLLPKDI